MARFIHTAGKGVSRFGFTICTVLGPTPYQRTSRELVIFLLLPAPYLFAFVLLFRNPLPDISRAVEQRHSIVLAASQKTNRPQIHQPQFLKIDRYRRLALVDQRLQILQMLLLHSPYQTDGCFLTVVVFFDLPAHLETAIPPSCNRKTIHNPLDYRLGIPWVGPNGKHLLEIRHGGTIEWEQGETEGHSKRMKAYEVL